MPNWCNNRVSIYHEDRSKVEALVEAIKEGNFCKSIVPIPEDLNIVAGRVGDDTNPEQIELERRTAANLEKYGVANWYDFCVNNWGTKWDVDPYDPSDVVVNEYGILEFGFDSAWAPPTGVYEALVEQGFAVRAYYYEGGMAFCGKWEDGQSEHYDIEDNTSTWVRENIPSDIDDYMGISDCMQLDEECENE